MSAIVKWRREHQPGGSNAGSVFTNPEGDSAGRLIEEAGLKGYRLGTAHVSEKHANFIQADKGGRADDVRALMEHVRAVVAARCGVTLSAEVRLLGFDGGKTGAGGCTGGSRRRGRDAARRREGAGAPADRPAHIGAPCRRHSRSGQAPAAAAHLRAGGGGAARGRLVHRRLLAVLGSSHRRDRERARDGRASGGAGRAGLPSAPARRQRRCGRGEDRTDALGALRLGAGVVARFGADRRDRGGASAGGERARWTLGHAGRRRPRSGGHGRVGRPGCCS